MTSPAIVQFIDRMTSSPEKITFSEVMSLIDDHYVFTPTAFTNGSGNDRVINEKGSNEGSCRIFAFAQLQKLTEAQTLHCFGDYYRKDVLEHPDSDDHANIRTFIRDGWKGIVFDGSALTAK
ncbi:HopJ type III effector protein [Eionea flava]